MTRCPLTFPVLIVDLAAAIALEADHLVENVGADEVFLAEACHLGCRQCALELARDRLVETYRDDIIRIFGDSVLRVACEGHHDDSA